MILQERGGIPCVEWILLTSKRRILEKLKIFQPFQKFPTSYGA
jgi:hypothetical protein